MINPQVKLDLKLWAANKVAQVTRQAVDPSQVTESVLRRDTLLSTQPSYVISFNKQGATINASEILINQNDAFLATSVRVSVKKLTAASTDALQVKAREFTYPNTFVFDGTAEVTTIFAVWNAKLSITQNQKVQFPKIWTGNCLFAPDQQYGDITSLITGPTYGRKIGDAKLGPNFGFFGIEPICLLGTDNTQMLFDMGAAQDLTESAEYNYLTITLGGFLVSGN